MSMPLPTEMGGGVAHDALVQTVEEMNTPDKESTMPVEKKPRAKRTVKVATTKKPRVKRMVNLRKPKEVRDLERQVAKLEKAIAVAVQKLFAVGLVLKVAPAAAKPKKAKKS